MRPYVHTITACIYIHIYIYIYIWFLLLAGPWKTERFPSSMVPYTTGVMSKLVKLPHRPPQNAVVLDLLLA